MSATAEKLTPSNERQFVQPFDLKESPDNPREISEEAMQRLKASLEHDPQMMLARPVIADSDGHAVAGNMRLRAAREMAGAHDFPRFNSFLKEHRGIPVFVAELDDARRREWMLRDNQEYGDWVPDELAQIIARHADEGYDTRLLGFSDEEVMQAIRRATGEALVPEPSAPPEPTLVAEAMVEIRCTRLALEQISATLADWQDTISGIEISVTS